MNPAEFDNIARVEQDLWWYRGQRRLLYRLLDPIVASRQIEDVLEAGCGTGYMSRELARRYGWKMTALDLEMEGLAHGRRLGLTRLVQGDIARLPFPRSHFDALVSFDVIVHFPRGEEQAVFAELARAMKPGGLFVIRVSALDILRSRHSTHAHERQRFTRQRLLRCAEAAGIRAIRCTYANSLLLPVALFKFRIWEPLTNAPPASGVAPVTPWLDRLLYTPFEVETFLAGNGFNLPIGQSLLLIGEKTEV